MFNVLMIESYFCAYMEYKHSEGGLNIFLVNRASVQVIINNTKLSTLFSNIKRNIILALSMAIYFVVVLSFIERQRFKKEINPDIGM